MIQCWEMAVEMVVVSAAELDRRYRFGGSYMVSHLTCWVQPWQDGRFNQGQ